MGAGIPKGLQDAAQGLSSIKRCRRRRPCISRYTRYMALWVAWLTGGSTQSRDFTEEDTILFLYYKNTGS